MSKHVCLLCDKYVQYIIAFSMSCLNILYILNCIELNGIIPEVNAIHNTKIAFK